MDTIQTNKKNGRPRTILDIKAYRRHRSQKFYADPINHQKQLDRMTIYRNNNRNVVRERNSRYKRLKTLEKRLKKIWIQKGLIK